MGRVKTLYVLRHAKSSWADPDVTDRDRPLASRGRRDARRLAAHLDRGRIRPQVVLCSPARRTRATWEALGLVLDDDQVLVEDAIYGASANELVRRLRRLPAGLGSAMVIGHNPGLEDLVELLTGDGDAAALRQLHTKFPTGALATLDLDVTDWSALGPGRAHLQSLVIPKQLPDP